MIKRWLRNWLMRDDENPKYAAMAASRPDVTSNSIDEDESLRFTVTPARGGVVVSVRHYDRKTDRNNYTNHVIHDDENVAESIGHIVSMEILRS
jgi:hypothetical protein